MNSRIIVRTNLFFSNSISISSFPTGINTTLTTTTTIMTIMTVMMKATSKTTPTTTSISTRTKLVVLEYLLGRRSVQVCRPPGCKWALRCGKTSRQAPRTRRKPTTPVQRRIRFYGQQSGIGFGDDGLRQADRFTSQNKFKARAHPVQCRCV